MCWNPSLGGNSLSGSGEFHCWCHPTATVVNTTSRTLLGKWWEKEMEQVMFAYVTTSTLEGAVISSSLLYLHWESREWAIRWHQWHHTPSSKTSSVPRELPSYHHTDHGTVLLIFHVDQYTEAKSILWHYLNKTPWSTFGRTYSKVTSDHLRPLLLLGSLWQKRMEACSPALIEPSKWS